MVSDINHYSYGKSRAERIIEQINASNAKKVALLMVLGFVFYHEVLHLRYGEQTFSKPFCNNPLFLPFKAVILAVGCCQMGGTKLIKNGSLMVACYIITPARKASSIVFAF